MLPAGAVIGGEYRLVRLLGRGGMGEVYEAVHERLQRRVAVKTIRSDIALDPASLARFRREAETAASLGHPNIVQVTDWKEPPGEPPFLVMEHLEGRALFDVIEDERRLAPGRVAFIGMQLLSGLEAAHRAGIVHRDVKPGNVFLLSTFAVRDLVKIVDFGIAKMVVDVAATSRRALTDFGQVLGTFAYMAPEQASGGDVDARADIFAAGATLFHALSGSRPTDAIVPGQPRMSLATMAPWLDERLAAVIDKAMARNPDERFASAQAMADALAPFASEEPSPGSTTIPEVTFRDTVRDRHADRFEAETKAVAGETQLMPPVRASQNPPVSAPTLPPPTPFAPPPPRRDKPWGMWIGIGVVAVACAAIAGSLAVMQLVFARRTSAPTVEQDVVDNMKLKPCPGLEKCTRRREGKITYPVCTRTVADERLQLGDAVLVKTGRQTYAGYVAAVPADGADRYVVKQIVGDETDDVTIDQTSRLCR